MEKQAIFKKGDTVYCALFGKGVVTYDSAKGNYPLTVAFEQDEMNHGYTLDGRYQTNYKPTLSLTEYRLEGFSQERPIDYRDYIGKWGFFWDEDKNKGYIDKLDNFTKVYYSGRGIPYKNFQPFSEELEAQLRKEGII